MEKIQAKLKYQPNDFIVEEIQGDWHCKISQDFKPIPYSLFPIPENSNKNFLWCELEKKGLDQFSAIKELTTNLNLHPNQISYAGTKDKIAWTSQRISLENPNPETIKNFQSEKIILKNFRWNKRKIKIGYLDKNHFNITLRDLNKKDAIKISSTIQKKDYFPNYFGPQRFGINNSNIKIGKEILKKKFESALNLIRQDQNLPPIKNPKSPIALIRRIPRKTLLMYINAVQSIIFNQIIETALEEGLNLEEKGQQSGILIGYKTRFSKGRLGEIEQEILKSHNLTPEDFNIEEISFLRTKGSFRKAITKIQNLKVEVAQDEIFPESKKIILDFTLPSGVYATTFLENFFIF